MENGFVEGRDQQLVSGLCTTIYGDRRKFGMEGNCAEIIWNPRMKANIKFIQRIGTPD